MEEQESVAVTIVSVPGSPDMENNTFFCTTEDLSAGGVKMYADRHVPRGSVVELRVAFSQPLRAFKHRGRVAWVKEVEGEGRYTMGVEFVDSDAGPMTQWRDVMRQRLGESGAGDGE